MNVRKATSDDSKKITELFEKYSKNNSNVLSSSSISENNLSTLIDTKGVHSEIFEIKSKIVACYLGFDKKVIESNKFLKQQEFFKILIGEILYDFTFLFDLVEDKTIKDNFQFTRMMMMSYLDETRKKTVIVSSKIPINKVLSEQLKFFRFKEEKQISINNKIFQLYELDNI